VLPDANMIRQKTTFFGNPSFDVSTNGSSCAQHRMTTIGIVMKAMTLTETARCMPFSQPVGLYAVVVEKCHLINVDAQFHLSYG
jgi:hypothetical protein